MEPARPCRRRAGLALHRRHPGRQPAGVSRRSHGRVNAMPAARHGCDRSMGWLDLILHDGPAALHC
jgi:hypothetical protein